MEILAIQGLIQTAALLLHHERRNLRGVLNQWKKPNRNWKHGR